MQRAFTLVELSIVLVVIGLLTGGILIGKDMVKGGEVSRIGKDMQTYASAIQLFKTQYGYFPGDFPDSVSYWGDNNNLCPDAAVTNGTPGSCNGDGDGFAEQAGTVREDLSVWMDLSLAGMIPGKYDYNASYDESRYRSFTYPPTQRGGAFTFKYYGASPNTYSAINGISAHFIKVGTPLSSGVNLAGTIFTPPEVASLDATIDDGIPTSGAFMGIGVSCVSGSTYIKSTTATQCSAMYRVDNR